MLYVTTQSQPTGVVLDHINNHGYLLLENDSKVLIIDLNTASLKPVQINILSGTTPLNARAGTTNVTARLCQFDPYRQKLILVSPDSGHVMIANTSAGLLELAEAGLSITPYDSTVVDLDKGYAFVLGSSRYLRIYSLDSSTLVNVADLGTGNIRWLRQIDEDTILAITAGWPAQMLAYSISSNSVATWSTAGPRTSVDKSAVLYIPSINTLVVVQDDNRLAFVTPTDYTVVDNSITSLTPSLFYHEGFNRIILTTANMVRMYDINGNLIKSLTLPSDIYSADLDEVHNVLAVATSSTLYMYTITATDIILNETSPINASSYYSVVVDKVFSRVYVLEHDSHRVAVHDYAEKLNVYLEIQRGATQWTGQQFNDQLNITVTSVSNEPVPNAVCEVTVYGNAKVNDNGTLTDSTTVTTQSDGTATVLITVTGPGAYTVHVRATK